MRTLNVELPTLNSPYSSGMPQLPLAMRRFLVAASMGLAPMDFNQRTNSFAVMAGSLASISGSGGTPVLLLIRFEGFNIALIV